MSENDTADYDVEELHRQSVLPAVYGDDDGEVCRVTVASHGPVDPETYLPADLTLAVDVDGERVRTLRYVAAEVTP